MTYAQYERRGAIFEIVLTLLCGCTIALIILVATHTVHP